MAAEAMPELESGKSPDLGRESLCLRPSMNRRRKVAHRFVALHQCVNRVYTNTSPGNAVKVREASVF